MQTQEKHYYTPEEYLELEEKAEFKSEYYKGKIFALAGASINHNRIARNLLTGLNLDFRNKQHEVFMNDMRLWISQKELFTYPDIIVICDKPEFFKDRDDTITNPLIIVEVLSKSTKNYDRGEKFEFYRSIPTLQEYILVDQTKTHIEQFSKTDDGKWILTEYNNLDDTLILPTIDFQISSSDIYNNVEF